MGAPWTGLRVENARDPRFVACGTSIAKARFESEGIDP
jgi:hypothetical protein